MAARWIVCVIGGPANGRKLVLEPNANITVGRAPGCDLALEDGALAGEHCSLHHDGEQVTLNAYDSELGTLLQGAAVQENATVAHGDWVRAGASELVLYEEGASARLLRLGQPASATASAALEALRNELPLFALVNAACDVAMLQLLRETTAEVWCLHDEPKASELAYLSPYLVALPAGSSVLDVLVERGWDHSWATYLRYPRPPSRLRAHLQTILALGTDDELRLFDPPVLRSHLTQCNAREKALVFGDIQAFFVPGDDGTVIELAC